MAKINIADIFAYKIKGKIYCSECVKDEGIEEITAKDIVLRKDLEDALQTLYFCDLCKKLIE